MTKKLKIKVCGITLKKQARELIKHGVDYVGTIHHESSPRHVETKFADELKQLILVTVDQPLNKIEALAKHFDTKTLQLHGNETAEHCKRLQLKGFTIIKAFSVDDNFDFKQCENYIECTTYFLFDTKGVSKGGNGKKFNWNKLKEYKLDQPFFLSGGIALEDAVLIKNLTHSKLSGLDLNSRFEESPGIKDIEKLKQFINQIRLEI